MRSLLALALCLLGVHTTLGIDYDGWLNIKMEHSINCNNEKYCNRGNISLKSLRSGTSTVDQIQFNKKHIEELEKIAQLDGFYTIKTTVTSSDNSKGTEFLSSMKAQAFIDNGLADIINAWVLPNGAVISVSFQVTNSSLALNMGNKNYNLNSKFFLHYIEQAPVPDTASYIQKIDREREAREKGDVKDNRSFLAKYWMYIIPVALFVMISGATNPEAAGQAAR